MSFQSNVLLLCLSLWLCIHSIESTKPRLSAGSPCRRKSRLQCEPGLTCDKKTCKISERGSCTSTPNECASGLSCVGPSGRKRCEVLSKAGEKCAPTGYNICARQLVCQNRVCKIQDSGTCTNAEDQCADGLSCVGTSRKKRCKVLMGPGGVSCRGKRCRLPLDADCSDNPDDCKKGLVCTGHRDDKKCREPLALGDRCGHDPFRMCSSSDVCDKKDSKCKIPKGGSCSRRTKYCVSGTKCAGKKRRPKCV